MSNLDSASAPALPAPPPPSPPTATILLFPNRPRHDADRRDIPAPAAPSKLDREVGQLADAVKALDESSTDRPATADLDVARGFARAVVACHAAAVPVSEAEVAEATRILAMQLRLLGARS